QRGLAGSRRAHDRYILVAPYGQVHAPERAHRLGPHDVVALEIAGNDHRIAWRIGRQLGHPFRGIEQVLVHSGLPTMASIWASAFKYANRAFPTSSAACVRLSCDTRRSTIVATPRRYRSATTRRSSREASRLCCEISICSRVASTWANWPSISDWTWCSASAALASATCRLLS